MHLSSHQLRGRLAASLGAALALASVIVVVTSSLASAHAIVRDTEPGTDEVVAASPDRVLMRFNEPVELAFGALRVFDTHGRRVDRGEAHHLEGEPQTIAVALEPDIADGTYTVTWRVVSADGHPIEEAFVFHVGAPGENPRGIAAEILAGQGAAGLVAGLLFGVARWLTFLGLLLLAGGAAFLVLVWQRGAREVRETSIHAAFVRRWRIVAVAAWIAVLVGTIASFVLQGAVAGGVPLAEAVTPSVLGQVARTRFGMVALGRLGVLVALAVLWRTAVRPRLGATRDGGDAAAPALPVWTVATGAVLLLGLLASPGLAGHAGTTPPVWANLLMDVLHVGGAAVWLGGVFVLVAAAYPATRALGDRDRAATLAPVIGRFSDLAVWAIALVVASGAFRAWIEVRAIRAVTGTPYGQVFVAKMVAFLPILALGAINNRLMKPRIERAVEAGDAGAAPVGRLRRLVTVEVAFATVVLALTAFLVNLPPGRVVAGIDGPLIEEVRLGSYNLEVLVDPNQVGENEVHLTARAPDRTPAPIEEMRVLFRMPAEGIGPLVGEGLELAPGHFVVQGRQLSLPGEWMLEVVARTGRFSEERAMVHVTVNPT